MCVKAGTDKYKLRFKAVYCRQDRLLKCLAVLFGTGTGRHGQVKRKTLARIQPAFTGKAGTWIKRAGVLMQTAIKNRRIGLESVLRTVAVMNVPIEDEYFLQLVMLLEISCGNSDIVEQTETHGPVVFGVMTRRPDGTKRPIN